MTELDIQNRFAVLETTVGAAKARPELIDPAARPIYLVIVLAFAIEAIVLVVSEFRIGEPAKALPFAQLCLLAMVGLFARRQGFDRAARFVQAVAIPPIAGVLAVTATVMLAAVSAPFVDAQLDAADELLGFDFVWLLLTFRDHPWLNETAKIAYLTFTIQASALFAVVALFAPPRRLWIMINAWVLALVVAALIFPFAPAAGPHVFHGLQEEVFDNWQRLFPWRTGPAIEALRDGTMRDVIAASRGFISIPSFHAVGGVIFAWSLWPSKWLRWPMLLLNIALIASTVVIGSHYLVDIVAGVILAALALFAATRWVEWIEAKGC